MREVLCGSGQAQIAPVSKHPESEARNVMSPARTAKEERAGSAYGIRTRDLHLERVVSWAARRMRHGGLAHTNGWGSRIRTSAYRSRVCRPTTRRIPNNAWILSGKVGYIKSGYSTKRMTLGRTVADVGAGLSAD